MPKVIDNYILQQKIGAGQFGDVFKGYHQQTMQQVAIKTIRRETIKGKFYELLENEIKVLKTCDNPNIIKLYAIKKTANHFYLMLQYCNQGDMLGYVRKLGSVPEQKAIKFFCQILNAFQDLVKHKIMHRDFKLANILLHDGNIKIADFGFAKLLSNEDYATTMLGSPLNMAPQVLGGNKYNSKADIWSIGACVWEMLYGKPPYVAGNMVDLLNMIKNKPLRFPLTPRLAEPLTDVIKKMLVLDSKRRISWNELFNHPINFYLTNKLQRQINLQLVEDQSLVMNTSKFYIKKNLVVQGSEDLHQKQKMNQYLYNVIKDGKKKQQFKVQPQTQRSQKSTITEQTQTTKKQQTPTNPNPNPSTLQTTTRTNLKKIMHYRNIYVFLANVSDQILSPQFLQRVGILYKESELVAYVIVQRILRMIRWLLWAIGEDREKCGIEGVDGWEGCRAGKEIREVREYIGKELEVFTVFNQSIQPNITKKYTTPQHKHHLSILQTHQNPSKQATPQFLTLYQSTLTKYIKQLTKQLIDRMLASKKPQDFPAALKHIEYCLIAHDPERVFGRGEFNFMEFYDGFVGRGVQEGLLRVERMVKEL